MKEIPSYYRFLVEHLGPESKTKEYSSVLELLYSLNFESPIEDDLNRANDGLIFRDYYVEKYKTPVNLGDESVSVLEVFLALANRLSYLTYELTTVGVTELNGISNAFWELIYNLKLKPGQYQKNIEKIEFFMERKYGPDGRGGIFPLRIKSDSNNQNERDLWYQLQAYAIERSK